jgi:hypothetical protein
MSVPILERLLEAFSLTIGKTFFAPHQVQVMINAVPLSERVRTLQFIPGTSNASQLLQMNIFLSRGILTRVLIPILLESLTYLRESSGSCGNTFLAKLRRMSIRSLAIFLDAEVLFLVKTICHHDRIRFITWVNENRRR